MISNYNSEAHAHTLAYQLHVDEMTSTLAQLAGPDFSIAVGQVEGLMMTGKTRLEALGMTIRLYRGMEQRARRRQYADPDECQLLGEKP